MKKSEPLHFPKSLLEFRSVIKVSLSWAKQYVSVTNLCTFKSSRLIVDPFLSNNWICLNTDGSVRLKDVFVIIGGLLRNKNGWWIIGFNMYLDNCAILDYDLWGILDGLKLTLNRGFERVLDIQSQSSQHYPGWRSQKL